MTDVRSSKTDIVAIRERHERISQLLSTERNGARLCLGPMDSDAAHDDRGALLQEIGRLTRELEVQKAVVDLAYIPHRNLVESRDRAVAQRDRLREFLEHWSHESHLQTPGDRQRFRLAAQALMNGEHP